MGAVRAAVDAAKTTIPALSQVTVRRPALLERLDALLEVAEPAPVLLVAAPAGFGKTTLLADWAARARGAGRSVAWCAFDENDGSCFRVWSAVLDAVERALPAEVAHRVARLSAPQQPGDADFLAALSEHLAGAGAVLVLENAHTVIDEAARRDLDFLLAHPPGGSAVVLSSRGAPDLPAIQGARVQGRLGTVRAEDLAFTREEVGAACPELSPEDVTTVWEWSEGWPALVRLMDYSLRTGPQGEVTRTTNDRDLAEYLFAETFRRQPDRVRHVLLTVSVPDVVGEVLAVRLSSDPRAAQVLENASRQSGLVTTTRDADGTPSYRMHPLLRSHLRRELRLMDPEREAQAHRSVALWMLGQDRHLDAVRHAASAADRSFLDEVVQVAAPALINAGEAALLVEALDNGAVDLRTAGPWTRIMRSAALLDLDQLTDAAAQLYDGLSDVPGGEPGPDLAAAWEAIDGHLRRRQGLAPDPARLLGPRAVRDPDLRVLLAVHRGATLTRLGLLDEAEVELDLGLDLATGLGRSAAMVDCLTFRAGVHAARHVLEPSAHDAEEALALGEASGWGSSSRMAQAHMYRAWAFHQSLQDGPAATHISRAVSLLAPGAEPTVRVCVHALYATVELQGGVPPDSRVPDLHHVVLGSITREVGPVAVIVAGFMDARASIAAGLLDQVLEVVETLRTRLGECGELLVLGAMHAEASGRPGDARAILDALAQGGPTMATPLTRLERLTLATRLAHRDHDDAAATAYAREALLLAHRMGCLRPLADGGADLVQVLCAGRGTWGRAEEAAGRVLAYDLASRTTHDALTARELEILRQLPSLSTVEDIAGNLYVSVNTVKTHVRSIYRKLEASSRREAVARARQLGLV